MAVARVRRREAAEEQLPSEERLYAVPRSMAGWMILSGLVGLSASWALVDGPVQVAGLAAAVAPLVWKHRRLAQARLDVRRQLAHLIEDMRLRLALNVSLGTVLHVVAAERRGGIVGERLWLHRHLITIAGPEALLERLARELRSAELQMLLRRLSAARQGGASYGEALRAAAAEVTAEVLRKAELEVEAAPLRLMFPMLVLLLPPILALLLYPPAYALIGSLAGAGPGVVP